MFYYTYIAANVEISINFWSNRKEGYSSSKTNNEQMSVKLKAVAVIRNTKPIIGVNFQLRRWL